MTVCPPRSLVGSNTTAPSPARAAEKSRSTRTSMTPTSALPDFVRASSPRRSFLSAALRAMRATRPGTSTPGNAVRRAVARSPISRSSASISLTWIRACRREGSAISQTWMPLRTVSPTSTRLWSLVHRHISGKVTRPAAGAFSSMLATSLLSRSRSRSLFARFAFATSSVLSAIVMSAVLANSASSTASRVFSTSSRAASRRICVAPVETSSSVSFASAACASASSAFSRRSRTSDSVAKPLFARSFVRSYSTECFSCASFATRRSIFAPSSSSLVGRRRRSSICHSASDNRTPARRAIRGPSVRDEASCCSARSTSVCRGMCHISLCSSLDSVVLELIRTTTSSTSTAAPSSASHATSPPTSR